MPIFFQQQINEYTRLGVWHIEEPESFFKNQVPNHREVTHPHKRLQHLAGRFLLRYLFGDFPYELIQIADTRKPFVAGDAFHFSISHADNYAAAIVSRKQRVGVDVELSGPRIERLRDKFLSPAEQDIFLREIDSDQSLQQRLTLLWSAKEAVFKWYGEGQVDFKENILLKGFGQNDDVIDCFFTKNSTSLDIHCRQVDKLSLTWTVG